MDYSVNSASEVELQSVEVPTEEATQYKESPEYGDSPEYIESNEYTEAIEEEYGGETVYQNEVAPENALADVLNGLYGTDAERVAIDVMKEASRETEQRYGVPFESSEVIARARVRGGGAVGNMTHEEERIFVKGLLEQERRIREYDPQFDLEQTLRVQPTLRMMLSGGEPLEKALTYLHMDHRIAEIEQQTEQRVLSQIRARNTRPQPISRAGTGTARIDFSKMSDEEFNEIDKRLHRGEKVYF